MQTRARLLHMKDPGAGSWRKEALLPVLNPPAQRSGMDRLWGASKSREATVSSPQKGKLPFRQQALYGSEERSRRKKKMMTLPFPQAAGKGSGQAGKGAGHQAAGSLKGLRKKQVRSSLYGWKRRRQEGRAIRQQSPHRRQYSRGLPHL